MRDRVLETLRLTASELKSDVSTNSTNPAYLTYIMDYIIFYCVCQEVFLNFLQFRIHCQPHIPPLLACRFHHTLFHTRHSANDFLTFKAHDYLTLGLAVICSLTPLVQDVRIELLFLFPKQGCYHYTSSCL